MAAGMAGDVPRIAFHLSLVSGRDLLDIGGATGLFPVACKAAGFRRVVVVDDFNDPGDRARGVAHLRFALHDKYGVEALTRDVLQGLDYVEEFDAVTSFDVLEHLHHSPKRLLHDAVRALRPDGMLVLAVPNCMNLRKRIAWPLGVGCWTSMHEWYEQPIFRSHVREPSVADLRYIARDLGLRDTRILGRNWSGRLATGRVRRGIGMALDWPLRLRPSLCSDLYLIGRK
jgi:SAM-dependent methyltransferase